MERDSTQPSPTKESVRHAEEAEVMPVDDQTAALHQETHTAEVVAEQSSAAVELQTGASHSSSRRASVLEGAPAEPVQGELTAATPVEAHSAVAVLETNTHETSTEPVREAESRASPVVAAEATASPLGDQDAQEQAGPAEEDHGQRHTGTTPTPTPNLPSPVEHNSVGTAGSLQHTSPGLRTLVDDNAHASTPSVSGSTGAAATAQPAQRVSTGQPPQVSPSTSLQAAVARSVEVYADAQHNTTAYRMDKERGSVDPRASHDRGASFRGSRTGSRAASVVQTTSGVGVLAEFQRGADNSHTNRMVDGSYSRYLQATLHMTEPEVYPSFYGAEPLVGTLPVSLLATQTSMEEARMSQRFQHTHPGMDPLATLDGGVAGSKGRRVGGLDASWSARSRGLPHEGLYSTVRHSQSRRADELVEWGMTDNRAFPAINRKQRTLGGHASASILQRELDLLEPEMHQELAEQRPLRRRAPQHCKPVRHERDFVYYNHKSKGFFVPHDLPPDTIMLNYNHTFDFGNGTRFLTGARPARRNPGAQAPLLYSETTRGSRTWKEKTHPSLYSSITTSARARTAPAARDGDAAGGAGAGTLRASSKHKTREQIVTHNHSLRTAHAINKDDLHTSQFRRTRTIEEVLTVSPPHDADGHASYSLVGNSSGSRVPSQPAQARGGHLRNGYERTSPVSSARSVLLGTRFTDKAEPGLLGVMGAAATSGVSARSRQPLGERASEGRGGALPAVAASSSADGAYRVSRLNN